MACHESSRCLTRFPSALLKIRLLFTSSFSLPLLTYITFFLLVLLAKNVWFLVNSFVTTPKLETLNLSPIQTKVVVHHILVPVAVLRCLKVPKLPKNGVPFYKLFFCFYNTFFVGFYFPFGNFKLQDGYREEFLECETHNGSCVEYRYGTAILKWLLQRCNRDEKRLIFWTNMKLTCQLLRQV